MKCQRDKDYSNTKKNKIMTIDLRYGETIEQMKFIPDKSIDFICCDLPYGTTSCVWDIIIPFDKLWEQYRRIIKDKGVVV